MKAKFRLGALEIDVEGDANEIATVAQTLSRRATTMALNPGPPGLDSPPAEPLEEGSPEVGPAVEVPTRSKPHSSLERLPDARTFFAQHSPTNNREATAVGAYYLKNVAPDGSRSATVGKDQMEAVFKEAKWKLPNRIDQTLVDAASAGYLNRVETGRYEISNVGHNLVVHTLGGAAESAK
jgi:hypothetical protein